MLNQDSTPFNLIFVGQLVKRKRLDLLLTTLGEIKETNWHLSVVGDGVERCHLENLSRRLGIKDRVEFEGAQANPSAVQKLFGADLLVLPSDWDGWGAVVNEALMRGVPVIASDKCGAADLLHNPECGDVFPAGSVFHLREILLRRMQHGKLTEDESVRIREWTKNIEGEVAASYLLNVIGTSSNRIDKLIVPWL
jgi:glycosyltransferase involved in cell wall biosynthesis